MSLREFYIVVDVPEDESEFWLDQIHQVFCGGDEESCHVVVSGHQEAVMVNPVHG